MPLRPLLLLVLLLAACKGEEVGTLPECGSEPAFSRRDAAPSTDGWPQFRLEPRHRGLAPEGTLVGPDLEETWSVGPYAIGNYSASKGSPSIANDRVYAGFDDGYLRAFDAGTGALLWEFATYQAEIERDKPEEETEHKGIHGTPAVAGGRVFIGDYSGWLYALDAVTGDLLWEGDLGGSIGSSPVVFDGHVFVSVEYPDPDGKAFVIDAARGCIVAESGYFGNHPHSSTSLDPGRGLLFVGANNGLFLAWDYIRQQVRWEYWMDEDPGDDAPGDVKSTAAVGEDTVYITSWDHKLHAIDIETGQRVFAFETGSRIMSSPSIHGDTIWLGSHDDHIYAVDTNGNERWRQDTGSTIISSPTLIPETGMLAVGTNGGDLLLLDMQTGEPAWQAELDGAVSSVPLAIGRSLYATDLAGVLWRFDSPDR